MFRRVLVLAATCLVLSCAAGHRGLGLPDEHEPGATFADGAREWRLMTLRDAAGRIPEDALQRARAHVQRMRRGRMGPQAAPAGGEEQTASGLSTIQADFQRENWRWLGPANIGGRLRSIVIHPTRPSTVFAGSVAGGIWRSDDGAVSWRPVDDFMTNLAIASLAINPRNPDEMYAGTGETFGNADSIRGAGLFKSVDGGVTWTQVSSQSRGPWPDVRRVAVSPDGTILLAAGRNGFFRSTDGGATYLSISQLSGSVAVAFHPTDSNRAILLDGSGMPRTTVDGGLTWTSGTIPYGGGRAEVVYSRSQPDTIYIAGVDGGIYVSHDGGLTFTRRYIGLPNNQTWYDLVIWCNPTNPNHLLWGAQSMFESVDGGASWRFVQGGMHEDQHVIVDDPRFDGTSNALIYVGNDGGVYSADARPGQAYDWMTRNQNLGVTQFYGAAGDPVTGEVVGGTQDNGTLRYRPNSGTNWSKMMGADGAFCAVDSTGPPAYYGETQYGRLARSINGGSMLFIHSGITDVDNRRLNFVTPFILDPNNPNRLLFGGASLWRTENARADRPEWSVIKPAGFDNFISAIAVAPGNPDIIWVAHGAGSTTVYKTTNGTAANPTWTRVTSLPGFTFVTRITIDPTNADIVYVSRGGFTTGNVLRTVDGGSTWTTATGTGDTGLPMVPVRDIEVDPFDPATIYAATEIGIFVSHTRGADWEVPRNGPANVSVDELFTMGKTLVAATHGRGLFALDLGPDPAAQLTASPNPRTFSTVAVGGVNTQTVTVTNSGTVPLSVQAMWTTGFTLTEFWLSGSSTCWNAVLPPGGTCQIGIDFRPVAGGSRTASLMIGSNAAGSPHAVTLTEGTPPPAPLPSPWASADVGNVGIAGTASYVNGTFTVEGAGADIWGSADAFHYVHRTLSGDGMITARVATIENTAAWTKMGVMIRGSLSSSAPYGLMLVSSGKGLAFQRRTSDGALATGTSGGAGSAPRWVRVTRSGQVVSAYVSDDGAQWALVGQDTIDLPSTAYVGIVAHSHDVSQLATATFDHVDVVAAPPPPPPPSNGLPAGWSHADVGPTGVAGSASVAASTFSVSGAGADVWGTTDAFHFAYRSLSGDGTIVARVATIENVNAWTKAGVMIRSATDPSSAHAFMLVAASATKGVPFQRRVADGGLSTSTSGSQSTAPRWVKLVRAGASISGYESPDGANWTLVASDTFTMPGDVLVGLAVSSHVTGVNATATFDNVTVTTPQAQWSSADVGATGAAGSTSQSGSTFTIAGAGADVWGTADAFHYAYQPLSGDGTIVARVAAVENVNAWTKAGVMIRSSLSSSSAHAFMLVAASATKGVNFQRRASDGADSSSTRGSLSAAPRWVKLVRSGNVISSFESADGIAWTLVGSDTFAMPSDVLVGLAVSSHVSGVTATATFDNVTISGG
jgi:regulation of enolase protein 1 (concanavalin A-like superfamily)